LFLDRVLISLVRISTHTFSLETGFKSNLLLVAKKHNKNPFLFRQVSISSTFLWVGFSYKILVPKSTKLCFGFDTFWRQNLEQKTRAKNVDEIDGRVRDP